MKVTLFNRNSSSEFEIGDIEDIDEAIIEVYGGTEVLTVCYTDRTYEHYTACNHNDVDMDHGWLGYTMLSRDRSINLFEDKAWVARENSLAFYRHLIDEALAEVEKEIREIEEEIE